MAFRFMEKIKLYITSTLLDERKCKNYKGLFTFVSKNGKNGILKNIGISMVGIFMGVWACFHTMKIACCWLDKAKKFAKRENIALFRAFKTMGKETEETFIISTSKEFLVKMVQGTMWQSKQTRNLIFRFCPRTKYFPFPTYTNKNSSFFFVVLSTNW